MTPAEVARVLTKAAAYDRRTVGEAEALAWHQIVGDLDYADALEAVSRHYAETDRWLMPVHLRDHARRVRLERVEAAPVCQTCGQSTVGRYHLRHCAGQTAIGAAQDRKADVEQLLAEVRDALPDTDSAVLRRREVVQWDRARERQARAEPNPHYDPAAAGGAS